jgi:hypothetical protein
MGLNLGRALAAAGLAALVALAACTAGSGSRSTAGVPPLDVKARTAKVIEVAGAYALKGGCAIEGYVADVAQDGAEWTVTFRRQAEKQAAGDFCTVYVDDPTMTATRLIAGK